MLFCEIFRNFVQKFIMRKGEIYNRTDEEALSSRTHRFVTNGYVLQVLTSVQYIKDGQSRLSKKILVRGCAIKDDKTTMILDVPPSFDLEKIQDLVVLKVRCDFKFIIYLKHVITKPRRIPWNQLMCTEITPEGARYEHLHQKAEIGKRTKHKVDEDGFSFPYNY